MDTPGLHPYQEGVTAPLDLRVRRKVPYKPWRKAINALTTSENISPTASTNDVSKIIGNYRKVPSPSPASLTCRSINGRIGYIYSGCRNETYENDSEDGGTESNATPFKGTWLEKERTSQQYWRQWESAEQYRYRDINRSGALGAADVMASVCCSAIPFVEPIASCPIENDRHDARNEQSEFTQLNNFGPNTSDRSNIPNSISHCTTEMHFVSTTNNSQLPGGLARASSTGNAVNKPFPLSQIPSTSMSIIRPRVSLREPRVHIGDPSKTANRTMPTPSFTEKAPSEGNNTALRNQLAFPLPTEDKSAHRSNWNRSLPKHAPSTLPEMLPPGYPETNCRPMPCPGSQTPISANFTKADGPRAPVVPISPTASSSTKAPKLYIPVPRFLNALPDTTLSAVSPMVISTEKCLLPLDMPESGQTEDHSQDKKQDNDNEEDFCADGHCIPVRPVDRPCMTTWLISQLKKKKINELFWIDEQKLMFKVLWKHGSRHEWTKARDARIFFKWAQFTGRCKNDVTRMKSNFRTAMSTLKTVRLIRYLCKTRGPNAYRVYQFIACELEHKGIQA